MPTIGELPERQRTHCSGWVRRTSEATADRPARLHCGRRTRGVTVFRKLIVGAAAFAVNGPEVVALKGVGTCTGNVTDGINTAPVTSIKFTLNSDPAHPGASTEATCSGLLSTT